MFVVEVRLAAENLKARVVQVTFKGLHFPQEIMDLVSKFMNGVGIMKPEYELLLNNQLPDLDPDKVEIILKRFILTTWICIWQCLQHQFSSDHQH